MTKLSLSGIDTGKDGRLVFRFVASGRSMTWEFCSTSFAEFVALLLSGRLGLGNDVHFDAASVSLEEGEGRKRGSVRIAIGAKATIVAPLPAQATARKPVRRAVRKTARAPR
jgi:hypothetical protein